MEGSHAKGKKLLSLAWRELDGGAGGKNGGFNGGASRLWQSWWRRRLGRCWSRRCYGGNGRRGDIERKKRERERDEGWKTWLFAKSELDLFHPRFMESTPIYRRWKRKILSSLEKHFGPWFGWEGLQPLVQSRQHELSNMTIQGCLS